MRKLRSIIAATAERNRPDLPLLSVVRERGVILRDITNMEENHNFVPDDLSNYKVVQSGQLAMNKMKAWQGSYGISQHDGIVSPAYFVFDVNGVSRHYFHAAIRSKAYIPFFAQASRRSHWAMGLISGTYAGDSVSPPTSP
jgi:type I restriction enzyme S subunit